MKQQQILLFAALGFGAYYLTTRKAMAGTAKATPATATRPTITGAPYYTTDPTAARVGAVASLFSGITSLFSGGSSGGRVSEAGDASSSAGEVQARQYYVDNLDSFAVNPPNSYTTYTGNTGGWLDSQ